MLKSTGQAVTHNNSKQNWSTKQLSCNKFRRMDKLATEVRRNNFIYIFLSFSGILHFTDSCLKVSDQAYLFGPQMKCL